MKKYVIDACSLINAAKNYNMAKKAFYQIWETFDKMVVAGTLLSSSEVLKEAFLPLTFEIQKKTTEILAKYPNMIKIATKGSSNADPFLVATAILEKGIIVTDEGAAGIPNICNMEGIPHMNLKAFLDEILE